MTVLITKTEKLRKMKSGNSSFLTGFKYDRITNLLHQLSNIQWKKNSYIINNKEKISGAR